MDLWHIIPTFQLSGASDEITAEPYQMVGPTGIVSIIGPTSKYGANGTLSTAAVRNQINALASDPSVTSALLYIDSPGGQVAGSMELAADVAQLTATKPTFVYGADALASAGYQTASQAGRIYVSPSTLVGSIGTMSSLADTSELAKRMGVTVHPVTSGGVKGAGMFGTTVTPEMLSYQQSMVNAMQEQFNAAVSHGRQMPIDRVRQLADGRLHLSYDAVDLGLVDGVQTLEATIHELQSL